METNKTKIQVNKNHYDFLKYVNKSRFISYYYQIKEIYLSNPKKILEIGTGNNFVKKICQNDFNYTTLDIDKELNPDIIGSVLKIPKRENSFDFVLCCQVLEHLPFNDFEKALNELARVSTNDILLSLPYSRIGIKFQLKIPFIRTISILIRIPMFYKKYKFNGEHYWEIGTRGCSLRKIKKIVSKYFKINKIIYPYENEYHVFFRLRKK